LSSASSQHRRSLSASNKAVFVQEALSQDSVKQEALTDQQVEAFVAAQKDLQSIMDNAPDTEGDQPDLKTMEQLDAVAKKHDFASYDD
jgi:hypothetical protein